MRKPAIQPPVTGKTETPPERHFLLAEADGAAAAARETRRWLEQLLDAEPVVAEELPAEFAERAQAYVELLLRANLRLNLTRVTDPHEVARLHLLDAVAPVTLLDTSGAQSAVDLGSGGGVPGIPLAIARPDVRWLLVDSVGKKADVLRQFVKELDLPNVSVVAERAEVLGQSPLHRGQYDFVAARACAPLPVLAELAMPLLAIDGMLVAWKGPLTEADEEVRRGRSALEMLGGTLDVLGAAGPVVLGGHTIVIASKHRPTPPRYPRRPGEPGRRPLG
jgi:16S rRNA (guanine527-N7)-methyltransferase